MVIYERVETLLLLLLPTDKSFNGGITQRAKPTLLSKRLFSFFSKKAKISTDEETQNPLVNF